MKQIIAGLILASMPHWLSNAVADTPESEATEQETHVVKVECLDGNTKIIQLTGDGDAHGFTWVSDGADADGDSDDGRSEQKTVLRRMLRLNHEAGENAESAGWLGVSIGGVPSEMVEQLEIEKGGVLVLHVVEDSPADQAGIADNDIVLSIDGGDAINGSPALIKAISDKSPGDVITVKLLRDGQPQTVNVELGSRADMPKRQWKTRKAARFGRIDEDVKVRGKMLRRGDDNEWVFEDLGNIGDLALIPDYIKMFIPQQSDRSTTVNIDDGKTIIETRIERDGEVLVVEQVDEGEITVSRTDEDGNETVEVYADKDELREADEDAFDAIDRANVFQLHFDSGSIEGLADFELESPNFSFDFDTADFADHVAEYHVQLQKHLGDAEEMHGNALAHMEKVLVHLNEDSEASGDGHLVLLNQLKNRKPKYSFRELDDGQIEVRIRKGDSEIVKSFSDENDLADRSPKLYDRYQSLLDDEE